MVSIKERGILLCVIKHCIRVEETIVGVEENQFSNDKNLQDIICFNIFQIGELTKQLSQEFVSQYNGVPWQKIKGMRDIIGHGYGTIKMNRVWETASKDIKPLHEYCNSLLKN